MRVCHARLARTGQSCIQTAAAIDNPCICGSEKTSLHLSSPELVFEDCILSEWSVWSSCSASCHGGRLRRNTIAGIFPSNSWGIESSGMCCGGSYLLQKLIPRDACRLQWKRSCVHNIFVGASTQGNNKKGKKAKRQVEGSEEKGRKFIENRHKEITEHEKNN